MPIRQGKQESIGLMGHEGAVKQVKPKNRPVLFLMAIIIVTVIVIFLLMSVH